MIAAEHRDLGVLYFALAAAGTLVLSYLVIGREMQMVLYGVLAALLFVVCFSSVRLSLVLLVLSMLLSPEIAVGSTVKRDVTLRLEDILLLVMTLGWLLRMAVFKDIGFVVKNPLNKPIVVFSALAILSTTMGIYRGNVNPPAGMLFTLKFIEYFFLYNVVVNYVEQKEDVNRLLSMLLFVFAVISVYALFQALMGGDVSAPFEGEEGERNTLGGYLALMGGVAGGVILHGDVLAEKRVLMIVLVIAFVTMLLSLSRSGWAATIVVVLVLFFSAKQKSVFLVFACLLVVALTLVVPDVTRERALFTFAQPLHPDAQVELFGIRLDTSTSARIYSIQHVLTRFYKHAFFGYGVTGFAFVDGQFIRILAEMGILGLGVFIWLLAGVRRMIRGAVESDLPPRLKGMAVGFQAGFWGLMAHALTANTFIIVRIAEPFWCLAGLLAASKMIYGNQEDEDGYDNSVPDSILSDRAT